MQNPLQNLAIRTRLILLATGSSCVAIAIASAGFSYFDTQTLKDALVEQTASDAELLAFTGATPLLSDDRTAGQELLRSLSRQSDIRAGMLINAQGEVLATWPPVPDRDRRAISEAAVKQLSLLSDFDRFHSARYRFDKTGSLTLIQPVLVADELIGSVYLQASRDGLHRKIANYRWIVAAVVLMSLFSAVLFAVLVQRRVSAPLLSLTEMARRISQEDNYSLRMRRQVGGEIGTLFQAFNRMLDQIQHSKLELAQANDELETRVESRTAQLAHARDCAEAANQAKSEFLANMSHEIRTPLNAVLGFTELLRGDDSDISEAERIEYLDTIHTSGQHLLQLINDILDLSRIEAGRLDVEFRDCSPQTVLSEIVALLRVRAREKGLELNYHWIGPQPELIQTDEYRLRQLLMNLVGNAIKFTSDGRVDVLAELEPVSSADSCADDKGPRFHLRVDVVDTGIGIEADRLEQVFEPFSQADTSITRKYGGTGLGLAISRRIAAALGGTITARSRINEGSTFTARVSAGPVSWPTGNTEHELTSGEQTLEPVLCDFELPRNVLIVDDGESNGKLIRLMLEKRGIPTTVATDSRQGIELAAQGRFDLILMDMQMPVLDGGAATRELRRRNIDVPVIALTANAMRCTRQQCIDAGCDGYLTKPIQSMQLFEAMRDARTASASS